MEFSNLLLLFLCSLAHAQAQSPTIRAHVNKEVLDFVPSVLYPLIREEATKAKIPDIEEKIKHGSIRAHDIALQQFVPPNLAFTLSNNGITWTSNGGSAKITGRWNAKYRIIFPIKVSGGVRLEASDLGLSITSSVFQTDGKPQIRITACDADMRHVNIKFSGHLAPAIMNMFRGKFAKAIKKSVNKEACKSIINAVAKANAKLLTLPKRIPLPNNLFVDYAFTGNPVYNNEFMAVDAFTALVYGNSTCHGTGKLGNWTEVGPHPGMLTTWFSEDLANCFLDSAHVNDKIHMALTKDIPQVTSYLKTTCTGVLDLCIGHFFPKLQTDYPNRYIDLYFHSATSPIVSFYKDIADLNVTFFMDFHINPYKQNPTPLARLSIGTFSATVIRLQPPKLTATINKSSITTQEVFSHIGNMTETFLSVLEKIGFLSARVVVESYLNEGVLLPTYRGVHVKNSSELHIEDGHLRLNLDLSN